MSPLGAKETVHEGHDPEGEVELNVLMEVGAQIVTVESVGNLKVPGRKQVHHLLLDGLRQESRQPLYKANTTGTRRLVGGLVSGRTVDLQ